MPFTLSCYFKENNSVGWEGGGDHLPNNGYCHQIQVYYCNKKSWNTRHFNYSDRIYYTSSQKRSFSRRFVCLSVCLSPLFHAVSFYYLRIKLLKLFDKDFTQIWWSVKYLPKIKNDNIHKKRSSRYQKKGSYANNA